MTVEYLAGPNIESGGVVSVDSMNMRRIMLGTEEIHTDDNAVKTCKHRQG